MTQTFTSFGGSHCIAAGSIHDVVTRTHGWAQAQTEGSALVFCDQTGAVIDLDLRGPAEEVLDQLDDHPMIKPSAPVVEAAPRRRGRPRLGVVSREVSLLPRHWEWLRSQPKSASAMLRVLIEERMKETADVDRVRAAANAAYGVMVVLAGDLENFEEASRALFAHDHARLVALSAGWPEDVRAYVCGLATSA